MCAADARLDVDWRQSARYVSFVFICSNFGAPGAMRQALTFMLIPLVRLHVLYAMELCSRLGVSDVCLRQVVLDLFRRGHARDKSMSMSPIAVAVLSA